MVWTENRLHKLASILKLNRINKLIGYQTCYSDMSQKRIPVESGINSVISSSENEIFFSECNNVYSSYVFSQYSQL